MAASTGWQRVGAVTGTDVRFTVDGTTVAGRAGESLAGALAVAGYTVLRHSPTGGGARGVFCLMGSCQECLVHVDDAPVLACMEAVRAGIRVALDRLARETGQFAG